MQKFCDSNFLLTTLTARELYYDLAAKQPIIDYHCHIDSREICEDRRFDDLAQLWLGGDHYKWRLLRSNGVEEKYVTGDGDGWEKFRRFAAVLPKAVGKPMVHWCHLELKNCFGWEGFLSEARVRAFRVPAGIAVEVWATTLHYAPCHVIEADGFRVAVVLPKGTNESKPVIAPITAEDRWLWARNKWLLAHSDSDEARKGAPVCLIGPNIDIDQWKTATL